MLKIILTICLMFLPVAAFAHPPTDISVKYDKERSILNIDITHASGKKKKHYVHTIRVYKNGDLFKEYTYQWQKHPLHVIEDAEIVIQEGDIIKVTATDNGGGERESVIDL